MAIFGLYVDDTKKVNDFVNNMKERLKAPNMFDNPFKGFIKKYNGDEPFIFLYLDLIWINPFYIATILTVTLLIVHGFNLHWTLFLTLPLWLGSFMFTKTFLVLATRFSLRKFGYNGKIKKMSDTELLLRLAYGTKRYIKGTINPENNQ